jgi:phytoene dehydrogenase-like protein
MTGAYRSSDRHDVVIVGAGLAGLTAAGDLRRAGLDVLVLERGDAVGGRVRTDLVDGMLLDRGFQLLNPAYPRVPRDLDLQALELCRFQAGAAVSYRGRQVVVADPRRSPRDVLATLGMPFGSWRDKLAFARWALEIGYRPARRIKDRPDGRFVDELDRRGLSGPIVDNLLRPFLSGVLADDELTTSRRLVELIVRSFIRATPGLPRRGMRAIPEQLAARLPADAVRLNTAVIVIDGTGVVTDAGRIDGAAVIVATEAPAAARLLHREFSAMRALTTFYHVAGESPADRPLLHLDAERRGPVLNTAVLTDVAPDYAPGRVLIASTVLGADDSAATEREVRRHAGLIYGRDSSGWQHLASYPIRDALPDTPGGSPLRRPVRLGDRRYVAGDHRDTPSIQGALVSGHRAAAAVLDDLRAG